MLSDLTTALFVTRSISFNLNHAAVIRQEKMMGGLCMVEAHRFIAAFVHLVHMLVRHRAEDLLWFLLSMNQRDRRQADCQADGTKM